MTLRPDQLLKQQSVGSKLTIALSEGSDPRIVQAALAARAQDLADIILVGAHTAVTDALAAAGGSGTPGISIHDPSDSPLHADFSRRFFELRAKRGVTEAQAAEAVRDPLVYAALMVREGHAAGTVGGAVYPTSDVVRAAIQMIGKSPEAALVSSFFLMYPPKGAPKGARAMVYADCGLVIDPSAQELASIAAQAANNFKTMMQETPRVAMLSFSTKGSATHDKVSKMTKATDLLGAAHPDLAVDGELQFDTAFVPEIASRKAPTSDVAGAANVMIFPDLDAGNIAYKITQRVAGYDAIGPVLQGLAKPANDLSRGCSAEDVTQIIAVTALQAKAS